MSFSLFDWIIIGAALLAILLGALRGFGKLILNGLLSSLLSLAVAVILALYVAVPAYKAVGGSIETPLTEKLNSASPVFTYTFYQDVTGDVVLKNSDPEAETQYMHIADAISENTKIPAIAAQFIEKAVVKNVTEENIEYKHTLSVKLAPIITLLIIRIALGIIGFILGLIIFRMLRNLNEKLNDYKFFKIIDRLLGVTVRLGMVFAAAYAVFYLSDRIEFFKTIADESAVLGLLSEINF